MKAKRNMPSVIGLCPDPNHTGEFYVPHGGTCPEAGCDRPLVEYVPRGSEVKAYPAKLTGLPDVDTLLDDEPYYDPTTIPSLTATPESEVPDA